MPGWQGVKKMGESYGSGWDVDNEVVGSSDFRWYKVRPGKGIDLIILSEAPIWYVGHFVGGRMHRCDGENCRYCADQVGSQLRYCVAVAEVTTERPGLLEMGRTVALEVRDLADKAGSMRGLRLFFRKYSSSRHSRMEVERVRDTDVKFWRTLPVPDVVRALELTWEKDGTHIEKDVERPLIEEFAQKFRRPTR